MSGFKLLAIRPLARCHNKFSKNLQHGTIYKFNNEYTFKDSNGKEIIKSFEDVHSVTYTSKVPPDIYTIENNGNKIDVNISALVGKNGSGKSSLLELLYATCYRIASRKRLLEGDEHGLLGIEFIPVDIDRQNDSNRKLSEIRRLLLSINVEIFYSINEKIYCINISKEAGIIHKLIEGVDENFSNWYLNVPSEKHLKYVFNEAFFYTISVNYSLYGLNENILGDWISELFHKNDGYQTPIVINPFREFGNIDVNKELHLAQTRFFTNTIYNEENSIINDKKVGTVNFKYDLAKSYEIENIHINSYFINYKSKFKLSEKGFICKVYNMFYDLNLSEDEINTPRSGSLEQQSNYIFYKILKISKKYKEYNGYDILNSNRVDHEEFNRFMLILSNNKSHITLKLRQTLNNLRFNWFNVKEGAGLINFNNDTDFDTDDDFSDKFNHTILLSDLIQIIKETKEKNAFFTYEELIPLGCHRINLYIINNNRKPLDFAELEELSSGEQHFIFSIQSILYHLININSVFNSESKKINYEHVNVILDEIELYFHPEFQRSFVNELLKKIQSLSIPNIKSINIIFCTHSPFILSDIPNQNILKLDDGKPKEYDESDKTFGANIHDLLADDFFLQKSFMGEFAHKYITELIDEVNKIDKQLSNTVFKDYLRKVEIIDEPFIKYKLIEMLENKKSSSDFDLDYLIEKKQKELDILKMKKKND